MQILPIHLSLSATVSPMSSVSQEAYQPARLLPANFRGIHQVEKINRGTKAVEDEHRSSFTCADGRSAHLERRVEQIDLEMKTAPFVSAISSFRTAPTKTIVRGQTSRRIVII